MTGIGASQKEKDPSRLLYRICGSGYIWLHYCERFAEHAELQLRSVCDERNDSNHSSSPFRDT